MVFEFYATIRHASLFVHGNDWLYFGEFQRGCSRGQSNPSQCIAIRAFRSDAVELDGDDDMMTEGSVQTTSLGRFA